jgi:hypothetical protein
VSKHKKYVPKHRQPTTPGVPAKALRNSVVLSGVAVAATGAAVGGGVLSDPPPASGAIDVAAEVDGAEGLSAALLSRRDDTVVSRSDRRAASDPAKAAALSATASTGNAFTRTEDVSDDDPRAIAKALLSEFGFGVDQFGCLDSLWSRESGWRVNADNPSSSAYGIPQALPGSKMSSAGADWAYNPETQIRWGLGYIAGRYGTPCSAWSHSQSHGWY